MARLISHQQHIAAMRMLHRLAHAASALTLLAATLLIVSPAQAQTETTQLADWAARASSLQGSLEKLQDHIARTPGARVVLSAEIRAELIRFAATADQLAVSHDAGGGSKDLSCIYRGLSEDVGVQLGVLAEAEGASAPSARALSRLQKAAADAALIGASEAGRISTVGACSKP